MSRYLYIILFLFIIIGCSKKKTTYKPIDSNSDSLAIYFDLANDEKLATSDRQLYAKKAFLTVVNQTNDSMHRVNLLRVANRYYNMGDMGEFEKSVRVLLKQSLAAKDTTYIAKSYSYLGDYYGGIMMPDSAYMYYFKAEKSFLLLNDAYNLGRTRLNKAGLQYNQSDYSGSEIAVFNVIRGINGIEAKELLFESYNLLGLIYSELEEFDKAIEYNDKAYASIDNAVISGIFQAKSMSLNNTGLVYQRMKNHRKAIYYFEQGLNQKDLLIGNPSTYATLLDNIAYSKFKLNEFNEIPELFYKSLKIRDSLDLQNGKITSLLHLSEFYAYKKDTLKALQFSNEALKTAQISKNPRNFLSPLKQLAVLEPKRAAEYTKEYLRLNDSLQKIERSMGNKFTRIEYETDKIKGEYSDLEVKNRNLVYVFSGLIIFGMFLYIIKAQKTKTRELLYKQQQQKANEDIYNLMINQQNAIDANRVEEKKRVAQELHDGVLGRMFGVRMNLDSLNRFNDDMAIEQRNAYITELKNIEQDIREISHDLNREKSELINNFVAIVDNLFEEQRKTFASKLISNIDSSIKWDLLSNAIKINVFRIIQESIQNINKYANAKTITVELKKIKGDLRLIVKDDGIGFNTKLKKKGIGVQNMISRTKECKGEFNIKSKQGEGTEITITVPIEKQIPS
ncbi:tetratricopeptide repeat protein [Flavobacterium sp. NG2]|uniref:tetratricopeptide repeat-containing sensor histidine kinase n=1 Tax=Flavobacterium sp. NG2 TaxID=3097547 RepID=UPI002A812D8C|nr:tetratricopeptide repeat protein [Flavobacterium sp. NG2]WPR72484.1 tetratricopeptide repeat protein [Flavobacterium sp. NG2]